MNDPFYVKEEGGGNGPIQICSPAGHDGKAVPLVVVTPQETPAATMSLATAVMQAVQAYLRPPPEEKRPLLLSADEERRLREFLKKEVP